MTTILLAALFICHFASDFAFTRQRMLIAKSKGWPPFPIMEHAAVHAVTMSAAFAIYGIEWKTIGILFLVECIDLVEEQFGYKILVVFVELVGKIHETLEVFLAGNLFNGNSHIFQFRVLAQRSKEHIRCKYNKNHSK